tara:strand:+ start:3703 stop:4557 length:855 start_codon:yes stop_codon:yes gene_type:complete
MKVIWVLENIKKNFYFYSKFNTALLLASVKLWKKNNPQDKCVLYCDKLTKDLLFTLKVNNYWDEIIEYKSKRNINTEVFWASCKVEVLSQQTEPVILLDNDTLVYKNIYPYLDLNKVYVSNLEIGKGYYPTSINSYVQKLSYKPRWKTESVNVSFLYLPDPKFTKQYSELSLKLMEEFTKMNAPNPQYLIFAEQLLLKHLLEKNSVKYSSIISTYWDCKKWKWGDNHENGVWDINSSGLFYKHYGPLKDIIKGNGGGYNYKVEYNSLLNCINDKQLNLETILNK